MEKGVLCRFRETQTVFKWLSSSLSADCGCHLIILLSDHATIRAGNPKNLYCGRRREYSGEWHACPTFRSFPKHLLSAKKYHNTQTLSGQVYIFLWKSRDSKQLPKIIQICNDAQAIFRFLYSTTRIEMLAPHCKPCWVTSSHQEEHTGTAWKAQRAGTEVATYKRFVEQHGAWLGTGV